MAENEEKSRKEEIITASHNEKNYPCGIISDKTSHPIIFQIGAEWADNHPREGLWDSKKVIEWLALHCELYGGFNPNKLNQMCENLIKAMEE